MKIFTKYNLSILFLLSLLLIQQSIIIDIDNRLRNHQNDTFELGRVTGCSDSNTDPTVYVTFPDNPEILSQLRLENECGDLYFVANDEIIPYTDHIKYTAIIEPIHPHTAKESFIDDFDKTILNDKTEKEREQKEEWEKLSCKIRLVTVTEYSVWMVGYLSTGNTPTHCYDYNFPKDEWYIAACDFEFSPLFGSNSINIIIPEQVTFLGGDLGHSNLYFMEDFKSTGIVPIYTDIDIIN